jgi:IMP dehydrogenase
MDTVTEDEMAFMMTAYGGLGIIHRYNTIKEQVSLVKKTKIRGSNNLGAAIGVTGDFLDRATALYDAGADLLCVDIAHGYHILMKKALAALRDIFGSDIHIMADSIRVGVGGGSLCSTRIVSGHGIPSLQSVLDVSRTTYETKIIADGGIRNTGDMVKALAMGADFIMVGSMLSGTDQTPGQIFTNMKGESYKVFRGMASFDAQKDWRGKSSTPEGISTTVPYRGSVEEILKDVRGGLSSGLSYSGARNLSELRSKATFVLQSNAAQLESSTHILWRDK